MTRNAQRFAVTEGVAATRCFGGNMVGVPFPGGKRRIAAASMFWAIFTRAFAFAAGPSPSCGLGFLAEGHRLSPKLMGIRLIRLLGLYRNGKLVPICLAGSMAGLRL